MSSADNHLCQAAKATAACVVETSSRTKSERSRRRRCLVEHPRRSAAAFLVGSVINAWSNNSSSGCSGSMGDRSFITSTREPNRP